MAEPLPLDDTPEVPSTTLRIVLISGLVAFIIGCVPGLATALIVQENLQTQQDKLQQQIFAACMVRKGNTKQTNERLSLDRENLHNDVKILEASKREASGKLKDQINGAIKDKNKLIERSGPLKAIRCVD